jgi:RNA-directed DNA polymerase
MNVQSSTTPISEDGTDKSLSSQWNSIDWGKVRATVNRLQIRIAKAVKEKQWNLVKRLQYLVTHSFSAKLLAVRTVTQNRGKRTPGIDGELWNTASDKMRAAFRLSDKQYQAWPLKRIYIPKPESDTKRPISIPTMNDRAMQALYSLALQPVAETTADLRSFGFRLFRSAKDASRYTYTCLMHRAAAEWVLEGDIRGCFDNIAHEWLKVHVPIDPSILNQFLKAGYVFERQLFSTYRGTPQGGIISPILANMSLDGIESILAERYPASKVHFIRYADDFIVTAPTKELAEEIRDLIQRFLSDRGLELSESKTVITHINGGFDFLGWNFRKYHGRLLMKPSKKSVKRVTESLRLIIQKAAAWSQDQLIKALNPIITGWTNYHCHVAAAATFQKLDSILWSILWSWAKRRHPEKGHTWIAHRYWHSDGTRNWVFKTDSQKMKIFADTHYWSHRQVKLTANPYLDREYFLKRGRFLKQHSLVASD